MISLFGKTEPEPTFLEKLRKSVSKTKAALSETVDTIFLGERRIDPSILKNLETALLSADLGVKPTREILDAVREKLDRNALSDSTELKREIKSHILRILNASTRPDESESALRSSFSRTASRISRVGFTPRSAESSAVSRFFRMDGSILRSPRKIVSTVSDSAAFVLLTDFLSFSRNVGSGSVFPNREIIRRALHSWRN